jgi:inward rectifier potassium channel
MVLLAYVVINAIFGGIYFAIGAGGLNGMDGHTLLERYLDSFFFSTQTFTTVGFGRISPVGMASNSVASLESLMGLLSFALATGLIYGRFSRPIARVIYSNSALISPYQNGTGLMFRCANMRVNQLIDVNATVTLSRLEPAPGGERRRKFYPLELERTSVTFFHLSWTVVHPITETSPLFGVSKEQMDESEAELLILLKAFDDSFSQTVHSRTSYRNHEILFGYKFSPMILTGPDGMTELDLGRIHHYEQTS